MGKSWMSLLSLLIAVFGAVCYQNDEDAAIKPTNVTVTPSARSLDVRWNAPTKDLVHLVSYLVLSYKTDEKNRKSEYGLPKSDTRHTIACLEPNMRYEVQVRARFDNNTTGNSKRVSVATKSDPDPGFLSRLWEQRVYVLIGAILMVVLSLFFIPCICCCYYCAKRHRSRRLYIHAKNEKKERTMFSKDTCLPSSLELQNSERQFSNQSSALQGGRTSPRERQVDDQVRFFKGSVHGTDVHTHSKLVSTSSQLSPSTLTLPPSYSHTTLRSMASVPAEHAPVRPPISPPQPDEFDSDVDDDDYQNDVFMPPQPDVNLYQNVRY